MEKKIRGNEKILIVQFKPAGDVLLTTPVARYLKEKLPDIEVYFLANEQYCSLLKGNPYIAKVIPIGAAKGKGFKYFRERISVIKKLRNEKIDVVLDYIGLPSSAIMAFLSGAKWRAGYRKHRGRNLLYNIKAEHEHSDKYTVLGKYDLLKPFGIFDDDPLIGTELFIPDDDTGFADDLFNSMGINGCFTVLFSPGSPKLFKKWPAGCYSDLGKKLIDQYGAKILILYGPSEKGYCEKIRSDIGSDALLLPETSLMQAAAVIKKASLCIFNCGGMKHISVAVGTPSVTIFGGTSHINWHPPGLEWAVFLEGDYADGDSTFGINPGNVIKKIEVLMEKGILRRPA
ncbi:MAG: glycosyltransferase family 9 protein [Elusimicrobiota bacterium]